MLVRRRRCPATFGSRWGNMRFVRGGSIAAHGAHARAREEERVTECVATRVRRLRGGASRGVSGTRPRPRPQGACRRTRAIRQGPGQRLWQKAQRAAYMRAPSCVRAQCGRSAGGWLWASRPSYPRPCPQRADAAVLLSACSRALLAAHHTVQRRIRTHRKCLRTAESLHQSYCVSKRKKCAFFRAFGACRIFWFAVRDATRHVVRFAPRCDMRRTNGQKGTVDTTQSSPVMVSCPTRSRRTCRARRKN
jgi:hypothetical protein